MAKGKNDYKISMGMAEFKGRTLAHLENIKGEIGKINGEIKEVKTELAKKACKEDIKGINRRIDNIKIISAIIGGIGGVIAGVAAFFGLKVKT